MLRLLSLMTIVTLIVAVTACGGTKVTRTSSEEAVDLSGDWNAADSKQVAKVMIDDVLSRPWIEAFRDAQQRKPVVKVGRVAVRTNGEVVDTDIFTNDIVRELINSARVRAVRATGRENQIRAELADQQQHASAESRKKLFQELGCDYLMTGSIKVQNDQQGRTMHKFYQTDLFLEDVQTGEIVWQGSHEISKIVERDRVR